MDGSPYQRWCNALTLLRSLVVAVPLTWLLGLPRIAAHPFPDVRAATYHHKPHTIQVSRGLDHSPELMSTYLVQ
jgi:hypothetical protein